MKSAPSAYPGSIDLVSAIPHVSRHFDVRTASSGVDVEWYDLEYLDDTVSNAFHGTGADEAEAILGDTFRPTHSDEYLGDGVYFYIGSIEDARYFAKRRRNKKPPVVLRATVLLGYCLDLDTKPHKYILEKIHDHIWKRDDVRRNLQARGHTSVPLGVAINIFATEYTTVDTVHGAQPNFESLETQPGPFFGSRMWFYRKRVLCVRTISNILSCSVVSSNGQDK